MAGRQKASEWSSQAIADALLPCCTSRSWLKYDEAPEVKHARAMIGLIRAAHPVLQAVHRLDNRLCFKRKTLEGMKPMKQLRDERLKLQGIKKVLFKRPAAADAEPASDTDQPLKRPAADTQQPEQPFKRPAAADTEAAASGTDSAADAEPAAADTKPAVPPFSAPEPSMLSFSEEAAQIF